MKKILSITALPLLAGGVLNAQAAGFEKGISWGARSAGMGGNAVSTSTGPEALYFNPSGLASGPGFGTTVQFSPTWVNVSGPALQSNVVVDSKKQTIPFAGVLGSYGVNEDLSFGVGVYAAGGLRAVYEGLDVAALNANFDGFSGTTKSELTMIEASLGGAYRIMPGLKVGASWRAAFVTGNFQSTVLQSTDLGAISAQLAGNSLNVLTTAGLKDLTAKNFAGFRLGAQYEPEGANWGAGLSVRTPITIKMKGATHATNKAYFDGTGPLAGIEATNAANEIVEATGGEGTAEASFPTQIALGSHFDLMDKKLRLHVGYSWANYKSVSKIDVGGSVTTGKVVSDTQINAMTNVSAALGAGVAANANGKASDLPDFETNWKDEHTGRLGVEYMGLESWVLRAGYAISTAVTPAAYGRATFSAPGAGHSLTAGVGKGFLGNTLVADLALEYGWQKGTIEASTANGGIGGDQKTSALGLHTGVSYFF